MRSDLFAILRCPEDQSALTPAESAVVAQLNRAIRNGRIRNRAGRQLDGPIDGGFVREAGDLLYPIVDDIPLLLIDEAIPLDQIG